jgi:hypothetical protein
MQIDPSNLCAQFPQASLFVPVITGFASENISPIAHLILSVFS